MGKIVSLQGTVNSHFGFTGELQHGQFLNLRARWYNTWTGTFTSYRWRTDESDDKAPYTHHGYAYALSNPIIYTDPSGKFRCVETAQNTYSALAGGVGGSQDMIDYLRFCYNSSNAADGWLNSSAAQQDALGTLIRLFTEGDLPGGSSPRASRLRRTDLTAAAERLEFVLVQLGRNNRIV